MSEHLEEKTSKTVNKSLDEATTEPATKPPTDPASEITSDLIDDHSIEASSVALNEERYTQFLGHVNQAMLVLTLAGGVVLGTQFPTQTCYAYISSCLLMWANVYFLVTGIYGVLQRRKSTAVILIGQALFLFGGLFVLMSFFKNELLWVILGCSTWLGALFWAQSIDKIHNTPPENT